VEELVTFIAKKLVAHPDDVQVTKTEIEDGTQYELRVNSEDMGRVIGKSGRTAKALRTIVGSAAAKANVNASLEIAE
jgi:predicted RNA-binding protein YlqC (UPF0109 family)